MAVFTIVQESFAFKNNIRNCYKEHTEENNISGSIEESNVHDNFLFYNLLPAIKFFRYYL